MGLGGLEVLAVLLLWGIPLAIIVYVLWLLTRLTQSIERIEHRLTHLTEREHGEDD